MKHSWERLADESSKSYHNFEVYRDWGPERSIEKAGRKLVKNPTSLARQSKKYRWVKRALEYDNYINRKKLKAVKKEIIHMARRQAEDAKNFQKIAYRIISNADGLLQSPVPNDRVIGSVLRFAERYLQNHETLVNTEREARGLVKEQLELSVAVKDDTQTVKPDKSTQQPVTRPILDIVHKIEGSKNSSSERGTVKVGEAEEDGRGVRRLNRRNNTKD